MTLSLPKIGPTDQIHYDGELLRLEREWDDGTISLTRVHANRPFLLDGEPTTAEWFLTQFAAKALTITPAEQVAATPSEPEHLAPDDPRTSKAQRIQFVLNVLDRAGCTRSDKAIDAVLDEVYTAEAEERFGPRPPAPTARKWLKRHGVAHGRRLVRCATEQGRGIRTKRDAELRRLRTDAAIYYWTDKTIAYEDAHAEHVAAVAKCNEKRAEDGLAPLAAYSLTWIRKACDELECWETWAAKYGVASANARFKANGRGVQATFAGEIGIIDHKTWDNWIGLAEIGDDLMPMGRPTCTAVYDVKTGTVSAFVSMVSPSLHNMLEAIKVANRPKLRRTRVGAAKYELLASIYTRFDTILPDNAWEFVGTSGQDSLDDLGSHIDWSRAGRPQDKAQLERFWLTLDLYLADRLPAVVFDHKTMEKLGYDPAQDKVILLSKLKELLDEAIAYYHIEVNDGKGAQPARLWEKERKRLGPQPIIGDEGEIDKMMGMVREITLTTSGIKLFKRLHYADLDNGTDKVTELLGRLVTTMPKGRTRVRNRLNRTARVRVKVKFNPVDIGQIHVWNHVDNEYVTLDCADQAYANGLSLRMHETVMAFVEAENLDFNTPEERRIARATLQAVIREAAPHAAMAHRKRMARLLETGTVRDDDGEVHAPSPFSGIVHDTALADRRDGGEAPAGPPARGKNKRGVKRPNAKRRQDEDDFDMRAHEPPAPETGLAAQTGTTVTHSPVDEGGDWGGLR